MASDDVIPSFASISGVDPFSLALGIRYLGEVNSVRSDRCHGAKMFKGAPLPSSDPPGSN